MGDKLAVVGSLNADLTVQTPHLPRPGETLTGSDLVIAPGGKSSNQAAAAARLGAQVALCGCIGDDANGVFLVTRLQDAGVDTSAVEQLDGVATGTALIAVDAEGENIIIISPGANGRLAPEHVERHAEQLFSGASILCLCLEVDIATVQAAARAASQREVRVVCNLSPSREVPAELLADVDILVVNEHELADLTGEQLTAAGPPDDWAAVSRRLVGAGPQQLVTTFGADGAVVMDLTRDEPPTHVPSPRVTPVDTTGCGDAFLGSLSARLAVGDDLVTAAQFAVRVGAFAATRHGAQTSYPTLADLEASGL